MLDLNKLTKAQLIALVNASDAPPARAEERPLPKGVVRRVQGEVQRSAQRPASRYAPLHGTATTAPVPAPKAKRLGSIEVKTANVNGGLCYVFKLPFTPGFVYLRSPKKYDLAGDFDKASGQWFIPVEVIDRETGEVHDQTEKLMRIFSEVYTFKGWTLNFCGKVMTIPA